ncbi:kinase-like domain-containing protein [Rhizophagus irregularis DAOM 181602=DAOM 197198]|nr:kinase-like domain-containing protein [Rhizophagus irregularis DAOM 181602=DAOM 197198]
MEQCWDADSTKRPNACTLRIEVHKLLLKFQNYQDDSQKQIISDQLQQLSNSTDQTNINYTSKIYQFENFPEPKNATEEEQEAFQSKPYSLNIPNNVDVNNEKNGNTESSKYKEINSNYIMQDDHKKQQTKKHSLDINDDDEKQDELKISDNDEYLGPFKRNWVFPRLMVYLTRVFFGPMKYLEAFVQVRMIL